MIVAISVVANAWFILKPFNLAEVSNIKYAYSYTLHAKEFKVEGSVTKRNLPQLRFGIHVVYRLAKFLQ